jgi:hypothetical protein
MSHYWFEDYFLLFVLNSHIFLFCHLRYLSYTLSSSRLARVMFPSLGSCHWSFWPLFFRLLFRGSVWWPPLEEEHIACELMCAGGPCGGVVERLGKLLNEEELPCWDIRSGWWGGTVVRGWGKVCEFWGWKMRLRGLGYWLASSECRGSVRTRFV